MNPNVYRDAPETQTETMPRSPRSASTIVAVCILVSSGVWQCFFESRSRFEAHALGMVITVIAIAMVIAVQRAHAAWKKRHDAKLMIEWERRLEEKV